jgi:hypothetical protein
VDDSHVGIRSVDPPRTRSAMCVRAPARPQRSCLFDGEDSPHRDREQGRQRVLRAGNTALIGREPGCKDCGNAWIAVTPDDEARVPLPDTLTTEHAVAALKNVSRDGFGTADKPFFLGEHLAHLRHTPPVPAHCIRSRRRRRSTRIRWRRRCAEDQGGQRVGQDAASCRHPALTTCSARVGGAGAAPGRIYVPRRLRRPRQSKVHSCTRVTGCTQ